MLQENLSYLLHYDKFFYQIESNGTMILEDMDPNVHLVVSPKIPVSEKVSYHYNEIPLYRIPPTSVWSRANSWKFVVSADEKSPYHNLPAWLHTHDCPEVYVSPMAIYREGVTSPNKAVVSMWDQNVFDHDACRRNAAYAAQLCQAHGYHLSLQTHLFTSIE